MSCIVTYNKDRNMVEPIIFYDGTCGFCHKFIALLLRIDRAHVFRYAPLQGETALRLLPKEYLGDLSTVVVWDDGLLKLKSDASVHVFKRIGGVWAALAFLLRICPRFIRDFVYDVIATNRYKWFGRYDSCRLPTTEERRLLLP